MTIFRFGAVRPSSARRDGSAGYHSTVKDPNGRENGLRTDFKRLITSRATDGRSNRVVRKCWTTVYAGYYFASDSSSALYSCLWKSISNGTRFRTNGTRVVIRFVGYRYYPIELTKHFRFFFLSESAEPRKNSAAAYRRTIEEMFQRLRNNNRS